MFSAFLYEAISSNTITISKAQDGSNTTTAIPVMNESQNRPVALLAVRPEMSSDDGNGRLTLADLHEVQHIAKIFATGLSVLKDVGFGTLQQPDPNVDLGTYMYWSLYSQCKL